MSHPGRLALFLIGAAGLAILFAIVFLRMPAAGAFVSPYGEAINHRVVPERHATDAVTAVNFDYRGFDTLGEEFILFVSVLGSVVLLRQAHEKREHERQDAREQSRDVPPCDALRVWIFAMISPKILFGIYVVIHGQLTPGGGFQGGVILATAALLIYLGENFEVFKRVTSYRLIEMTEAVGAGAYAVIGAIAWVQGYAFLTNIFPLGTKGQLTSGGTIPAISLATGLEVTAGFVLLLYAFLQKTLTEDKES